MIFLYYTGQEAWRKRRFPAHFISKLSDSDGEAAETQVWLDFALDCGYITRRDHDELYATYENVAGGLVKMMSKPDAWCGPAKLREPSAPYSPTLPLSHTPTPPSSPTLPSSHTPPSSEMDRP